MSTMAARLNLNLKQRTLGSRLKGPNASRPPHCAQYSMCSSIIIVIIFFTGVSGVAKAGINSPNNRTLVVNTGDNVSLVCTKAVNRSNGSIFWIHTDPEHISDSERSTGPNPRYRPQSDGSIFLPGVTISDAKTYTCADAETNDSLEIIRLEVKSVPPAVTNLTVFTHSVYALVEWVLPSDGGYPIKNFVLSYRLDRSQKTEKDFNTSDDEDETDSWQTISDLESQSSSKTVFGLKPNSTYYFRVYAVNALGPGPNVSVAAETKFIQSEVDEANQLMEESESSSLYMKITIIIVSVALVTFAILGLGISLLLFRNCARTGRTDISCETTEEEEAMELVPHITLNPSFNIDMLEYLEAEDESPSDELSARGRSGVGGGQAMSLFGDRSNLVDIATEPSGIIARPKR